MLVFRGGVVSLLRPTQFSSISGHPDRALRVACQQARPSQPKKIRGVRVTEGPEEWSQYGLLAKRTWD